MFQSTDIHLLQVTAKFHSDGRSVDIYRRHQQSLPVGEKSSPVLRFHRFIGEAFANFNKTNFKNEETAMTMTTSISPTTPKSPSPTKASLFLRALNWLAEQDRRYRENAKLQSLSPEQMIDMNILR